MKKYYAKETETNGIAIVDSEPLTAEQEAELSKRILAGEEAKKILAGKTHLTSAEAAILRAAVDEGETAFETLVLANQPRAMKFAIQTWRKNPNGLNELDDYRQAALKVICECARTFDWRRGCRFSSYVHLCIQHEMLRENGLNAYAVSIPEEKVACLAPLKRRMETMSRDEATRNLGMRQATAAVLLSAAAGAKSLQEPAGADDSGAEFGETLADSSAVSAEEIDARIDGDTEKARLLQALEMLPEDERTLLKGRMGFSGDPMPMKAFVGICAKSISGVQKKQIAAQRHLLEIYRSLPPAESPSPEWETKFNESRETAMVSLDRLIGFFLSISESLPRNICPFSANIPQPKSANIEKRSCDQMQFFDEIRKTLSNPTYKYTPGVTVQNIGQRRRFRDSE